MVRSDLVVLPDLGIDCDLRLFALEPFSIKHFSSKCSVEAFVISGFPWAAWIDWHWLNADTFQPVLVMQCNELRPVVRAYNLRFAMFHQHWKLGVSSQSLETVPLRTGPHGCIPPNFLTAPIAELIVNEADGPDMAGV